VSHREDQAREAFALAGVLTPPVIATSQNDYNPTGLSAASCLRLSSSADVSITGMVGGSSGRLFTFYNIGSTFDIILSAEDVLSAAANRFAFSSNVPLAPGDGAVVQYDTTASRWRVVSMGRAIGSGTTVLNMSFFSGTGTLYQEGAGTTWEGVGDVIYAGSNTVGSPNTCQVALTRSGTGTCGVQIVDITNGNAVIASVDQAVGFSPGATPTLFDLGAITNLPIGPAVFEVQVNSSATQTKCRIHSLVLYKT
jgi:hypothetical protein